MPQDLVSVDSLIYTFIETGVTLIRDMWLVTPDHTAGSVMADSLHTDDLVGSGFAGATWTRKAHYLNIDYLNEDDQLGLKAMIEIDDLSSINFGRMYLKCTVNIPL